MSPRAMTLYHATTPAKVKKYQASGRIVKPVRGFTTIAAALAWACRVGRTVILEIHGDDCHKLPDHHNDFGEAWWIDHDVKTWTGVYYGGGGRAHDPRP